LGLWKSRSWDSAANFGWRIDAEQSKAVVHAALSVQNEYSLLHRDPEREVFPECARLGLAFLPY
jgi:aryl-alcohol dehydrogenase-like predicted oxidoreductase